MYSRNRNERWLQLTIVACLFLMTVTAAANGVRFKKTYKGESRAYSSATSNNRNNPHNLDSQDLSRFLQEDRKNDDKNKDDKNKDVPVNKETKVPVPTAQPTFKPTFKITKTPTTPNPTGETTEDLPLQWSTVFPLQRCEGDCDVDEDCDAGLVCYQRDGGEAVPRCFGMDESRIDYCVASWELPPPPTLSPTRTLTASPTRAPYVSTPTVLSITPAPSAKYVSCQKAEKGEVYTTDFSFTIGYYYEVIAKRSEPLMDVARNVDAIFQKILATSLVDCDLGPQSQIQGVSPSAIDNLAGTCVSKTMSDLLGNNEDLICYQMQGSVEVYLAQYYYVSLSAANSREVKETVWDTLRENINNRRRRKLVRVDLSQGIYGMFFLSGTALDDGIDSIQGSSTVSVAAEPGTSTGEAIGIVFGCFVLGILLFAGFRIYTSGMEGKLLDKFGGSIVTESDNDSRHKRTDRAPLSPLSSDLSSKPPPPPPPMSKEMLQLSRPSTWRVPSFNSQKSDPPRIVHYSPRRNDPTSHVKHNTQQESPSPLHHDYGDSSLERVIRTDPREGRAFPPKSNVGVTTDLDEDQFRVTGYSKMSNISTLAEQLEQPAKITPIIRREYQPILLGRNHENRHSRGVISDRYGGRPEARNLNESHEKSVDSFGFPMATNKSVSTANLRNPPHSKGIPRSHYSSMTTKHANRRVQSSRIPSVQEEDSCLSEERLVPYYREKKLDLSQVPGHTPKKSAADLQSIKSGKSAKSVGSFRFETRSTSRPRASQNEFTFIEHNPNPYSMQDPISMTLARNAMQHSAFNSMQHSAFKPRKLGYDNEE